MASLDLEKKEFPYIMVMEYMIDPLKQLLRESSDLTTADLKQGVGTIDAITQMILSSTQSTKVSSKERDMVLLSTVQDICFPLFYCLHTLPDSTKSKSDRRKALSSIVQCITVALDHFDDETLVSKVVLQTIVPLGLLTNQIDQLLSKFKDDEFHQYETEKLDALTLLEFFQLSFHNPCVMTKVFSDLSSYDTSKDEFLQIIFHAVLTASETESLFNKSINAVVKILPLFSKSTQQLILSRVWQKYTQPLPVNADGKFDKESLWKSLFVFYCLKDWFFPVDEIEDAKLTFTSNLVDEFWIKVQAGLLDCEPSRRKLSMYLLKRLVDTCQQNSCIVNNFHGDGVKLSEENRSHSLFWWHPEKSSVLSAIWEDYIVIMEVLEEKQVHVIKPLLPRARAVISACSMHDEASMEVRPVMHSSWLVTLISRCFQHESHFMSRWGAMTFLTINMKQVPFVQHGQLKFLSSDLVTYLQENKLYSRYEGSQSGRCSPVREAVASFFANLFASLNHEEKVGYLTNVLQKIRDNTWGSIPLVFVFQGLSRIPPQPIMSFHAIEHIRYILQACLTTHEVATRGAIQCFIGQMLIKLVDLEQVGLSQFFPVVAGLNRDESFQRGTVLWNEMMEWLGSGVVQKKWTEAEILTNAVDYLKRDNYEDSAASIVFEGPRVVGIVRMLLLFADVTAANAAVSNEDNTLKELKMCPLGHVLAEISLMLSNIGSRTYVNTERVDASLALFNCFVKEIGNNTSQSTNDKVKDLIQESITNNFGDIVTYIIKRLSQDLTKAEDLDEIKFYADFILVCGSICDKPQAPIQALLKFVGNIFSALLKEKQDPEVTPELEVFNLSSVTVMKSLLGIVCASDCDQKQKMIWSKIVEIPSIHDIPTPFTTRKSGSKISNLQIGRVISHFVSSKWHCKKLMYTLQARIGQPYTKLDCLVEEAMNDLSIGSGDSDIAVIQTLGLVMDQLVLHASVCDIPNFIKLAWSKLMEERKNMLFWMRIECIIPAVIHPSLLKLTQSEITSCIEEFLDQLLEMAISKTGVTFILMQRLTTVMTSHDQDRTVGKWLVDRLIDASVFGAIYEKGKRLLLDIFAYIEDMGDQLATNQITSSASKNDTNTRIIIINWLSLLKPSVAADQDFAMVLLRSLRDRYLQVAGATTYKQFSNSYHHRLKHRMLLVLVLLSEFIEEDASEEFLNVFWQSLILECHPSVRHNLEWLVMRLILRFPNLVSSLWKTFSMFTEKRSMCVCSLFLILPHLGPKLPEHMQTDFYSNAFSQALSWSLAHHYNTRIFAQACLMRLWQQCNEMKLTHLLQRFHVVQSTADFIYKNGNCSGTVLKLLDNFMFSGFDPIRDFSAETIFHTLPRLAAIAEDEWILPEQLLKQYPSWKTGHGKLIPLLNGSDDLAKCEEGPWRMKAQTVNEDDIVETTDGDFQKKIVSWRQMAPDQETEAELITQRRRLKDGGLVLVTSLIDKVPNLGGLCRTSEIFGVSEFVIGNLTHLEDHMFQSLSVSAQKWLNITEVPRHQITKYMEEKKSQGYILVGVEQTANSVPLDQYVFPKNTLLLLGNEKEGIPPDMIQTLDVCVEIPQQGIIRSLNVHVCGALIVWEYTRQLMTQACE